jgi:hypothetical protein
LDFEVGLEEVSSRLCYLTLKTLTWKIWWAKNGSRWQMEFNSAFKGFKQGNNYAWIWPSKHNYIVNYKYYINYIFRSIIFLAIISLNKFTGENYTIYNMIRLIHQCWWK